MLRSLRRATVAIIAIAATVTLLAVVTWIGFPSLAPWVAGPLLEARGYELLRLETRRPRQHGLHVAVVEVAAADGSVALQARRIAVAWDSPLELLRNGLRSAVIDTLDVKLLLDPEHADPALNERAEPSLRPGPMLATLPMQQLDVRHLHLSATPGGEPLTATGSLRVTRTEGRFEGMLRRARLPGPMILHARADAGDHLTLSVSDATGSPPMLDVAGTVLTTQQGSLFRGRTQVHTDRLAEWFGRAEPWPRGRLDLTLDAHLDPMPTLTLGPESNGSLTLLVEDSEIVVALALGAPVALTLDAGGHLATHGTFVVDLALRHPQTSLQGRFELSALRGHPRGDFHGRVDGLGTVAWPQGGGGFAVTAPVVASIPTRTLAMAAGARLDLHTLQHQHRTLAAATLEVEETIRVAAPATLLAPARMHLSVTDPERVTLTGHATVAPDHSVAVLIEAGELPLVGNDWVTGTLPEGFELRSGRIGFSGQGQRSATGAISGELSSQWRNVGLDAQPIRLRGAGGSATLTLAEDRLDVATIQAVFEQIHVAGPTGSSGVVLLERGNLTGSGTLAFALDPWRAGAMAIDADLEIESLARDELRGRALDVALRIRGEPTQPNYVGTAQMRNADLGLPITDLSCNFDHGDDDLLGLTECRASLLGGEVRMPRGELNVPSGTGYFPLAVTGVELGALLGLMQDPALDGHGTLDGSLPLRLRDWQPALEQGWLTARAPGGMLAYAVANNVLEGIEQPALKLALRAVRDLRYERLASRVDYADDGTLTFAVDLFGSNPDIEGGRPIQLNLNVTQNLLQLLQSLQLSGKVEQDIERRLRRVQP
ncbi:MAG: hypothetical protein EA417_19720 [Gammaproteobacteria bacterium]|nr:MAG: hypothetical protein EA417_19720 [Gammaproteobacteria bacterium]